MEMIIDRTAIAQLDAEGLAALVSTLPDWPWPGEAVTMHRITSGLSNVNWRMVVGAETFFLKVPGIGTEAYISRDAAHSAALVAHATGVGPAVVYYDAVSGIEVSEFLQGYESSTQHSLSQPDTAVELMALYRRLHAGELLPITKTIFDMIDEHLAQVAAAGRPLRPWQQDVVDRWLPIQAAYIASGLDLVPGHNDMLPSNFMVSPDGPMMLIDYDYAANNDRYYEVGGIATLYLVEPEVRQAMLVAYFGEVTSRDVARASIAGLATAVKWGLWALLNSQARDFDFDFEKYGNTLFTQARHILDGPDIDTWVSEL